MLERDLAVALRALRERHPAQRLPPRFAERLDTLVGCFGIGLKPKGGDPQGLRRAAQGVVRLLVENGLRIDVTDFSLS